MKLYRFDADEVMFTSDTHFGHDNIIRFCDRPFKDADHMDEMLIELWNEEVEPDQVVFHLGDFAFKGRRRVPAILDRLNGDIVLIRGNHDKDKDLGYFKAVHDLAEVKVDNQSIVMCHYAMTTWNNSFRGAWHIHGHSHGTLPQNWDRKICDVGVDSWGYKPVSYSQLEAEMRMHGRETVDDLNSGFIQTYGKEADLLIPDPTPK